ncbi:uncharacterized protein BJ171DRAFT_139690 [Polychytrium aggregatum]|uniref:uncharacterized protein n=1 Tax=Polychytrium aggregatum TaxID=110093 RepID=UPI0022FF1CDD|nr:uncharacterized protein BJ171DRAFT_250310 [Polychytrium aggregatum]XP_052965824.1 uncharacterized protein BJ171DRAFT_139690 [Polychytrium aggregatum]KAI9193665.1 hypothetical protein BJ171DRAFT_250310 [Polychytrium aggregatum]KAI9203744.1 hypothetical protein BJ171DRAFT_139690 [Polychytrium aggregatum]
MSSPISSHPVFRRGEVVFVSVFLQLNKHHPLEFEALDIRSCIRVDPSDFNGVPIYWPAIIYRVHDQGPHHNVWSTPLVIKSSNPASRVAEDLGKAVVQVQTPQIFDGIVQASFITYDVRLNGLNLDQLRLPEMCLCPCAYVPPFGGYTFLDSVDLKSLELAETTAPLDPILIKFLLSLKTTESRLAATHLPHKTCALRNSIQFFEVARIGGEVLFLGDHIWANVGDKPTLVRVDTIYRYLNDPKLLHFSGIVMGEPVFQREVRFPHFQIMGRVYAGYWLNQMRCRRFCVSASPW